VLATPETGQNQYQTASRDLKGAGAVEPGGAASRIGPMTYPNCWVRLVRQGDLFTTYVGDNGVDWTVQIADYMPSNAYPATIHVGIATTSHNNNPGTNNMTFAEYRNFSIGPLVTLLRLENINLTGGTFSFSFMTTLGVNYVVEYKTDLNASTWAEFRTEPGTGGLVTVNDPGAGGLMRFYRVRIQ